MKLDRNENLDGRGKYALIKLRETDAPLNIIKGALTPDRLTRLPVDLGDTPNTEFFVIRLKDKYAYTALQSYAEAAQMDDAEYASEIFALAAKALTHKLKKKPD